MTSCGGSHQNEKNNLVSIEAKYGENNTVVYGGALIDDEFTVTAQYESGVKKLKSEDFNFEIVEGSTFSDEKVKVKLSMKDNESISTLLEITPIVRDSLKILFIGNSFSDDTIEWMVNIAKDLNISITAENMYIGGCDIATHYKNILTDSKAYTWVYRQNNYWSRLDGVSLKDRIEATDWDYISFQQVSGYSGISSSYTYLNALMEETESLLVNPKKTQFVFNMTWAYQSDSTHGDFSKYNRNQNVMYSAIVDTMKSQIIPNSKIKTIIPNGTAIQNARTSYIGDHFTRDGYHLSYDFGRYIAGLTAIKSLTGQDINKVTFSPVDEDRSLVAKESVNNAYDKKLEVINSIYLNNPYSLEELNNTHNKMDITFTRGFYDSTGSNPSSKTYREDDAFSNKFACSQIFETNQLPNGSVIYIKNGYKYRPDGWFSLNSKSGVRPEITNNDFTKIDDNWKKEYNYRAFNISKNDEARLSDDEIDELNNGEIFIIFTPKS